LFSLCRPTSCTICDDDDDDDDDNNNNNNNNNNQHADSTMLNDIPAVSLSVCPSNAGIEWKREYEL